jgi:hypothetical protein
MIIIKGKTPGENVCFSATLSHNKPHMKSPSNHQSYGIYIIVYTQCPYSWYLVEDTFNLIVVYGGGGGTKRFLMQINMRLRHSSPSFHARVWCK